MSVNELGNGKTDLSVNGKTDLSGNGKTDLSGVDSLKSIKGKSNTIIDRNKNNKETKSRFGGNSNKVVPITKNGMNNNNNNKNRIQEFKNSKISTPNSNLQNIVGGGNQAGSKRNMDIDNKLPKGVKFSQNQKIDIEKVGNSAGVNNKKNQKGLNISIGNIDDNASVYRKNLNKKINTLKDIDFKEEERQRISPKKNNWVNNNPRNNKIQGNNDNIEKVESVRNDKICESGKVTTKKAGGDNMSINDNIEKVESVRNDKICESGKVTTKKAGGDNMSIRNDQSMQQSIDKQKSTVYDRSFRKITTNRSKHISQSNSLGQSNSSSRMIRPGENMHTSNRCVVLPKKGIDKNDQSIKSDRAIISNFGNPEKNDDDDDKNVISKGEANNIRNGNKGR